MDNNNFNMNDNNCYYNDTNCRCSSFYATPNHSPNPSIFEPSIEYQVAVPINLAKSLEGKYFVGYADNLSFGNGTSAWARLYNPPNSNVNLHVTVWTISDISESSFRAQVWFNTFPPGMPQDSTLITPSNLAFSLLPRPKVRLQYSKMFMGNQAEV